MAMAEALTLEQVRHVARLSRLAISEEEVRQYAGQLSAILDYISQLNELKLEGVEPMAHAMDMVNVLRADEAKPGLTVEQVLANAPQQDTPFFKVPKVLDDDGGGA